MALLPIGVSVPLAVSGSPNRKAESCGGDEECAGNQLLNTIDILDDRAPGYQAVNTADTSPGRATRVLERSCRVTVRAFDTKCAEKEAHYG